MGVRAILGTVTAQCANLSGMESTQCPSDTVIPPRGTGTASLVIDTTNLAPASGSASRAYRIYVVVDPDGIYSRPTGNPLGAPHNWHWQDVTLTPLNYATDGIKLAFEVQNGQGTIATISYISQGTPTDVVNGLITAVNSNPTLQQHGVQAAAGSGSPPRYLTLFFADRPAVVKSSTEFRAALLDGKSTQLYFVPQIQQGAMLPTLTASNDERGQNNEGWGLMTVFAKGANPDAVSQTAVDLSLSDQSLAAVHTNATMRTGWVRAYPDQQLPVRISAFADRHSRTVEHAQLFLGHPDQGGELLAAKQILGVDASQGGHAWHTWATPGKPGVYTLYARLRERPGDPQPGNNLAKLRVVVLPRWLVQMNCGGDAGAGQ